MKKDEELVEEGYEGDVEHGLADQMVSEAKQLLINTCVTLELKFLLS